MPTFLSRFFRPAPDASTPPKTRLALEALEVREVPAVSVVNGNIEITQTKGNDVAIVSEAWGGYVVMDNLIPHFISKARVTGDVMYRGGAGNDSFTNNTALGAVAHGEAGNDTLRGGTRGEYFVGGDGNDTLYGNGGDDALFGGKGNDRLFGGDGADDLKAEAGNDYIEAGSGNDYAHGGEGNDELYGQAGNDTLEGYTGNDWSNGGSGNDTLYGSNGDDTLLGEAGDDRLYGEKGTDTLRGGSGNDYLDGGVADWTLEFLGTRVVAGNDALTGGAGSDRFVYDTGMGANIDKPKDFATEDQLVYPGLETAVNRAFAGVGGSTTVAGHGFYLHPITVQRTADGQKIEGYFRHEIVGPDDKVFFSITMKTGEPPVATITSIELGGLTTGKFPIALKWVVRVGGYAGSVGLGGVGGLIAAGATHAASELPAILDGIGWVQRKLIVNWGPSAVAVVDAIAARLARGA